jgi:hypothetical protein
MIRETPSLILINRMLRIGTFCPLHSDLSLDGLHITTSTLFQQRMQLHPVFQLDLARSVNVGPFESFSSGIICGRVSRGEVLEDGRLVELALVLDIDLASKYKAVQARQCQQINIAKIDDGVTTHLNWLTRPMTSSCCRVGYFFASLIACIVRVACVV